MSINHFIRQTALVAMLCCTTSAAFASQPTTSISSLYSQHAEKSTLSMDFTVVNELLHAGVLDMGRSTRSWAKSVRPNTGTRMRHNIDGATENETNRFFYENLAEEQEKIVKLRKSLESIPSDTPLSFYTKRQQLAYWLNLYNVTVINEIAQIYPVENLESRLSGELSFFSEKLLNVQGVALSLNDIHYEILPNLYQDEPLVIYGLYQGYRGSPNIRKKAYTGYNVFDALKDNAEEFINSNRGTQFNGAKGTVRVAQFYKRNIEFFPDFQSDLKAHLLEHANKSINEDVANAKEFVTNIKNYRTADIYGTFRNHEGSVATDATQQKSKKSYAQVMKLRELMRVRAVNLGGGRVTVTDLESQEEK
ncbi:DUF547 domain-containing protein [Thalassotalea sp. M1531]|uniref:DUF547 domain-containing protein n=1 Tax=Thalassotalea algicola TaxID=2716224 RepID=A0A7Y0Q728_9GAMM|nr:DUF547 domain-containing protein [Thalassotalea algicola]NMP30605.1 DUF547 domain-containing protein [Thalassotalea algicola]